MFTPAEWPGGHRRGLLSVESSTADGSYVLRVTGEIDRSNSDLLAVCMTEAEASRAPQIVVDLSRLRFMDSSGLRVLLGAAERGRVGGYGDRLSLVAPSRGVRRVIELTGTAAYLPLRPPAEKPGPATG